MARCIDCHNYASSHTYLVCWTSFSAFLCEYLLFCLSVLSSLFMLAFIVFIYLKVNYCFGLQVTPLSWADWAVVVYLSFPVSNCSLYLFLEVWFLSETSWFLGCKKADCLTELFFLLFLCFLLFELFFYLNQGTLPTQSFFIRFPLPTPKAQSKKALY